MLEEKIINFLVSNPVLTIIIFVAIFILTLNKYLKSKKVLDLVGVLFTAFIFIEFIRLFFIK